jgi:hypothetical protein
MKTKMILKIGLAWTLLLLILGGLLASETKHGRIKNTQDGNIEYIKGSDSLRIKLETSRRQTDSLRNVLDSVITVNKNLSSDRIN